MRFCFFKIALIKVCVSVAFVFWGSSPLFASADGQVSSADDHGPIGVMGDHRHKKGEWMISLRTMRMSMSDNLRGSDKISRDEIATGVVNSFASMPMMPPTLRIVPIDMTVDMQMLGAMYAPSDSVTFMLMTSYMTKEMSLLTYQGGTGTTRLGRFSTKSSGQGDTKVAALIRGVEGDHHSVHFNLGLSVPTGSVNHRDTILTPIGMRPEVRLPYSMQLGSGTYDFEPGATYTGGHDRWGWGAQYKATLRIDDNDEGYTLGDIHQLTSWASYAFVDTLSGSFRVTGKTQGDIDGRDEHIAGPVQTADPDNYGGERIDASIGLNFAGQRGVLLGHRFALEYTVPISQDVNGVQMEMDSMLSFGYQFAF